MSFVPWRPAMGARWRAPLSLAVLCAAVLALTGGSARAAEPAACLDSNPTKWPAASRPYFMVVVDTSGSMGYGVGSNDSCGYGSDRIDHARCAVRNTLQAFGGQANFGLAGYAWKLSGCSSGTCGFSSCDADYAPGDDDACGPLIAEPTLGFNIHAGANVFVPMLQDRANWLDGGTPDTSNVDTLLSWVDDKCTSSVELGADSNTPLGGVLFNMWQYYSGTFRDPFGSNYPSNSPMASPLGTAAQGEKPCRSVNVILITDGDETCDAYNTGTYGNYEGLAVSEAARLYQTGVTIGGQNFKVKVHVIGFVGATKSALDHIASAGGTTSSYSTANETQLSAALAKIIQGAVPPEVCDNTDNNCNGCTDEGYAHYADVASSAWTCCAWSNAAQRNACLTTYKGTITAGNPKGDVTKLPCTTSAQQTDPASWLCYDPGDTCDGVDNNGNQSTDEGTTKCGNPLHCPTTETCNGQDDDCDGTVDNVVGGCSGVCIASAETCNGCDDDCNGIVDNGAAPVTCGLTPSATVPAYCLGTRSCNAGATVAKGTCVAGGGTYAACVYGQTPLPSESCNGLDDDCSGQVDDNIAPIACNVPGSPALVYYDPVNHPKTQCKQGQQSCVNGSFANGACTGWVGPSAEVCDGIDNDCDGVVDDGTLPGVGVTCGSSTGACKKGTTACVGGTLVCNGGTQPVAETCNGVDDDCNGVVDDSPHDGPTGNARFCWAGTGTTCSFGTLKWSPPAGATCNGVGSLTSPCSPGTIACVGGAWACQGAKAPGTEVCDGVDNDCDGQLDETNVPALGSACGSNVGACKQGQLACVGGKPTCNGGVGATSETCNGADDDCNGTTDDGALPGIGTSCTVAYDASKFPGARTSGACRKGVSACQNGGVACIGGVAPQPEVCNGLDDDCDGQVDEVGAGPDGIDGSLDPLSSGHVVGATCGQTGGACKQGHYACISGAVVCSGAVGPQPEVCNGVDDDCNGQIDEGSLPGVGFTCGSATPPCIKGVTACVAGALACTGGVQPGSEVCNDIDDDCNGLVDDQLTDGPLPGEESCWSLAGTDCSWKALTWSAPAGADCHGVGTLTTPCATGAIRCIGGSYKCQGDKSPTAEVCDGTDDDCNGQVDENFVPQPCGSNLGTCKQGLTSCLAGVIQCNGAVGPQPEACNGIDDNCNGIVDDGIILNVPCSPTYDTTAYPGTRNSTGECAPGVSQCDGAGNLACAGGKGPQPEICDGKDNDCDGLVDELGPAPDGIDGSAAPGDPAKLIGGACGSEVGACAPGKWTCTGATFACVGGKGPQPEVCDCVDNDCDGQVDEETAGGDAGQTTPICGTSMPAKTCVSFQGTCQCAQVCKPGEFNQCPTGPYTCEVVSKSGSSGSGAYCVADPAQLCGDCSTKTVILAGDAGASYECAPAGTKIDAGAQVPECACKGQLGCHRPCYGVTCTQPGTLCTDFGPKAGTCVVDNCFNIPCPVGQVCNLGACEADPCAGVTCPAGEYCKPSADFSTAGCAKSCAGVTCAAGEQCHDGACEPTGCGATGCGAGEVCGGPEAGTDGGSNCVPDRCVGIDGGACPNGGCCDPVTGACGNCACQGIVCPANQACQAGECVASASDAGIDAPNDGSGGAGGGSPADASHDGEPGTGASDEAPSRGVFGLTTGGGGCSCETGPGRASGTGALALGLVAALALGARRRRRRAGEEVQP